MVPIVHAYLAECQRQRATPHPAFLSHLDSCAVDCDLDAIPLTAVRIFAMALARSGDHTGSSDRSIAADRPRLRATVRSGSLARPVRTTSRTASASQPAALQQQQQHRQQRSPLRLQREALRAAKTGSSQALPPASDRQLRCLRLRCVSVLAEHAPLPSAVAGTGTGSRAGSRTGRREAGRSSGTVTDPANRSVLRVLVEGICRAVTLSTSSLATVELIGLPLSAVAAPSAELLRALARCRVLRVLRLDFSSLTPALLASGTACALGDLRPTTTPLPAVSFPALVELTLRGCGLTDGCTSALRLFVSVGRERAALARWQRTLRVGTHSKIYGHDSTAAASATRMTATTATTDRESGLERLDVSRNALGDAALVGIARTTRSDSRLRVLDFSENRVTNQGLCDFVATGVLEESGLDMVDLSRNPCSDASTVPPPLPRYLLRHQCVTGGLGQLLIMREHSGERPSARQQRHSPGQLSLQTSEVAGAAVAAAAVPSASGAGAFAEMPPQPSGLSQPRSSQQVLRQQQQQQLLQMALSSISVSPQEIFAPQMQAALVSPLSAPLAEPLSPPLAAPTAATTAAAAPTALAEATPTVLPYVLHPASYILPVYHPFPAPAVPPPPPTAAATTTGVLTTPQSVGCYGCYGCYGCCHRHHACTCHHGKEAATCLRQHCSHRRPSDSDSSSSVDSGDDEPRCHRKHHQRCHWRVLYGRRRDGKRSRTRGSVTHDRMNTPPSLSGSSPPPSPHEGRLAKRLEEAEVKDVRTSERADKSADIFDPMLETLVSPSRSPSGDAAANVSVVSASADASFAAGQLAAQSGHQSNGDVAAISVPEAIDAIGREVRTAMDRHLRHQLSLVERAVAAVDNYELELTEKLERHHQQQTTRLDILRKELTIRLEKLMIEQQSTIAAVERVREKGSSDRETSGQDTQAEMSTKLLGLLQLMMGQIEQRLGKPRISEHGEPQENVSAGVAAIDAQGKQQQREKSSSTRIPTSALGVATPAAALNYEQTDDAARRRELISAASNQLRTLGW